MYAVIKTGGKQYRVAKDDVITVERVAGEAGGKVEFDQVLMLDDGKKPTVGTPIVDGAKVAGEILEQGRGDKVLVFKKKRRKNHRRLNGHRQDLSVIRITDILAKGKKAAAKKKETAPKEEPKEEAAEAAPEETAAETPETSSEEKA